MTEQETPPAAVERTRVVTGPMVAAIATIVVLASGWFALSRWGMHTPTSSALGEALGVAFALLVVISVIGAVINRERPAEEPGAEPDSKRE
jgi:hypothetical protein